MKSKLLFVINLCFVLPTFSQSEFINFYPWTSGSTTGVMTSDPDIGEFGTKSGCYTATTTVALSGGSFQTSNPQFTSLYGTTLGLRVGVDYSNTNQITTITIDIRKNGNLIDAPVKFNLYDINAAACASSAANRFIDVVNVKGYKRTNATTVNTAVSYNPNTMTNLGTGNSISSYTITGSSSAAASLSSQVEFTNSICRIEITYTSGTGTPNPCSGAPWPLNSGENPRAQEIAISPIEIPVSCAVPLPIEFGDLYTQCNNNRRFVYWYTNSELNNDYFEIQLSNDGENFESFQQVKSKGNSQNRQDYSLEIPPSLGEKYYCRIVQFDLDGRSEIRNTSSIENNCLEHECYLFPNPTNENCTLYYDPMGSRSIQITVINTLGEVVFSEQILPKSSQVVFPLNFSAINSGVYQLLVKQANDTKCIKFVKL